MSEEKKLLNTNMTVKNIERIDEVAESMARDGITGKKPNRSAAANVLIGVGYHAWRFLMERNDQCFDSEIMGELEERGYDKLFCKKEENTDV